MLVVKNSTKSTLEKVHVLAPGDVRPIDLSEVGVTITQVWSTSWSAQLGIYLPGITPADGYTLAARLVHETDQFTPGIEPEVVPLNYVGGANELWHVTTTLGPTAGSSYGQPGGSVFDGDNADRRHARQPDSASSSSASVSPPRGADRRPSSSEHFSAQPTRRCHLMVIKTHYSRCPPAERNRETMWLDSKLAFARMVLGTAGHFAGLISQSMFERSGRVRLREIGRSLGYVEVQPQLETAFLNEILNHQSKIQLTHLNQEKWGVTVFELAVINAFIAVRKPINIFEIGTFVGRTTLNMYLNAEKQARITTIDLPPQEQNLPNGRAAGEMIRDLVDRGEITLLFGNSLTYDFSPYYGTQDLVFIDANHTYDNVKNDSAVAIQLIRDRNACVLWHDYLRYPGITRAVNELAGSNADAGRFAHIAGTTLACLICP